MPRYRTQTRCGARIRVNKRGMTELTTVLAISWGGLAPRLGVAPRIGARKPSRINRKERAMKLTSAQIERTLTQFEGEAIPDSHPVVPQLNSLFGEHTFFLDRNGLNIVEPAEAARADEQSAKVVNLASWSD